MKTLDEKELIQLILVIFSGLIGMILFKLLFFKSNLVDLTIVAFIFTILFKLNMTLKERLKNYWFAFVFAFSIMVGLYFFLPNAWDYSFAILLAYVIADGFSKYMLVGGRGIIQVKFISNKTINKGHGYLVFILIIVLGTAFSGWLTSIIIEEIKSNYILANLIVLCLISVDYWVNYYKRN